MQIFLVTIGKFKKTDFENQIQNYLKLTSRFTKIEWTCLPEPKSADPKQAPSDALRKWLEKKNSNLHLTLLDEKGKEKTSRQFASTIESMQNSGVQNWVLAVSGAHGFDESLKKQSNSLLSLSQFTLPHELASVVLAEQLFRGFAILNNHPYHND